MTVSLFWKDDEYYHNYYNDIVAAFKENNSSLKNKYLYLGNHGAMSWLNIEKNPHFQVKISARYLLDKCFDKVLDVIHEDSSNIQGIDIVSLGSGTGGDDIIIIDKIWKRYKQYSSLYLIDLSRELLKESVNNMVSHIRQDIQLSAKIDLHAICVDIEKICIEKKYIAESRRNNIRLFHLLGLTLGNNREFDFLRNISNLMDDGDYLLIGVDFCLDNLAWRKESVDSYKNAEQDIKNFLAGPLLSAINVRKYENPNEIMFSGNIHGYSDYVQNKIYISVSEEINSARYGYSDVDDALSISRYYTNVKCGVDENLAEKRLTQEGIILFDYSNKYYSDKFIKFINDKLGMIGLVFVEGDVMKWNKDSQHLVLLKKDMNAESVISASALPGIMKIIYNKLKHIYDSHLGTNANKIKISREAGYLMSHFAVSSDNTRALTEILVKNNNNSMIVDILYKQEVNAEEFIEKIKQIVDDKIKI
jgi:uncharacterized SAM-dependent methyltransferase